MLTMIIPILNVFCPEAVHMNTRQPCPEGGFLVGKMLFLFVLLHYYAHVP
jgi:hypothetical protein